MPLSATKLPCNTTGTHRGNITAAESEPTATKPHAKAITKLRMATLMLDDFRARVKNQADNIASGAITAHTTYISVLITYRGWEKFITLRISGAALPRPTACACYVFFSRCHFVAVRLP